MSKQRRGNKPAPKPSLGLEGFQQPPEDQGLSLEQLSQAYAQLLDKGDDPYREPPPEDLPEALALPVEEPGAVDGDTLEDRSAESDTADDACPVSPRSILEAMLFVGHPHNEPLTNKQVASLMRGVRPDEIDELVAELNGIYAAERRPYSIISAGAGYCLALREEFAPLRDKFHGRVREARLNQAAVEVLAIVAYNQPLTRPEIDKFRGKPSGSVLSQLVRRELLRIDRPEQDPHAIRYHTTERFLDLFGLDSLADLPRSQDLDRA